MLYCGPYIKFFKCMTVIKYIFKTKIKAHKITIKKKKVKNLVHYIILPSTTFPLNTNNAEKNNNRII